MPTSNTNISDTAETTSTTSSSEAAATRRIRQSNYLILVIHALITALALFTTANRSPQPYHTSALSGYGWVLELLTGHPGRIRCELGVSHHVFDELIVALRRLHYSSSRGVTLEEKLAIFLYTCVTGLTIRHVGERFQRANETISKCFKEMLNAFSSDPFYSLCYVLLTRDVKANAEL